MKRIVGVVVALVVAMLAAGCEQQSAYEPARLQCEKPIAQGGDGGAWQCGDSGDGCRCYGLQGGREVGYPLGIAATCEAPDSWPVRVQVLDPRTGAYHDEIAQPVRYIQKRWTKVDDHNYQCVPVTP